jgi:hypothetical protein
VVAISWACDACARGRHVAARGGDLGRGAGIGEAGRWALHPSRGHLSDLPPDRRRRIGWKWPSAILCVVCVLLAVGAVAYHRRYTPPDCSDPRTLALVHTSLVDHFHMPDSTALEMIQTVAGGYIAFRFVCTAQPIGFTREQLPPGTIVPATVHYISELTPDGSRHEVHVSIRPLLILEPVE